MDTFVLQKSTMRKLILEVQMSVDGFIAAEDGSTDWMLWNWGPDWKWDEKLQRYHTELTQSADCILLSRQMAEEGFNAHWQSVAKNPDDTRFTFANHVARTDKIVFTHTLDKSASIPGGWENTSIADGDFVREIQQLKQKDGKNILVYGGAMFVSSLLNANLIDEVHLLVNPVAIGKGLRIFNGVLALSLIKSMPFDCGIVLHQYRPNTN